MAESASIERAAAAGLPADRLAARVLAHSMIEQTQVDPRPELVERLAEQARAAGWGEVEVLLQHCRLIHAGLEGAPVQERRDRSDAMLGAADRTGDEILIGLALASRALFLVDTDRPESGGEDVGGMLARAVAMLDDAADIDPAELGLRAVELPACFVECGQAYHRQGLWELEEEMYARAAEALAIPLPAAVQAVAGFTRRALVINRLESAAALTSGLLEVDRRAEARQVASAVPRPEPAEVADLPPGWGSEVRALERLLDVAAGRAEDPAGVPDSLWAELSASTWDGYRACLLLAAAVGAQDEGDVAGAASRAERAVALLDDYKPSITTLALHLAAQGAGDEAALRYARHLALLRWRARLEVLGAARSRLAAARVLRQGEQLSRQAYVDGLTGLANRHAESRHLARLRRRGPLDRLGVVLVDVDFFKSVNDTYGHAVGDEVLRMIGMLLQAAIRPSDLAVRLGGDEFLLLIDLPLGAERPLTAHAIVHAVGEQDWHALAPGLRVGVSAGQAVGAARDVDRLMGAADEHLYRAKATGRGRAVIATGVA
jgi:diguanylate cyclase (GGDEF)-like protein